MMDKWKYNADAYYYIIRGRQQLLLTSLNNIAIYYCNCTKCLIWDVRCARKCIASFYT